MSFVIFTLGVSRAIVRLGKLNSHEDHMLPAVSFLRPKDKLISFFCYSIYFKGLCRFDA